MSGKHDKAALAYDARYSVESGADSDVCRLLMG